MAALFDTLSIATRDDNLQRYIPFSNAITPEVATTRNGDYMSTWKVKGLAFEGLSHEDIDARMDALNIFIRSFSNGKFAFWIHRVRRAITDSLSSPSEGFAKDLLDKYYSTLGTNGMMATEIYFTVLYRPFVTSTSRAIQRPGNTIQEIREEERAAVDMLKTVDMQVRASLYAYGISLLSDYEEGGIRFSRQREFYSYLINGNWQKIPAKPLPLYKQLSLSRLLFGNQVMETRDHYGSTYSAFIDIKDYAEYTEPGILNAMLGLPHEYIETHSFCPLTTRDALEALRRQRNQLISSEDKSSSQINDIEIAMDQVGSNNFALGEYHYCMHVKADNALTVLEARSDAIQQLSGRGFLGIGIDLIIDHAFAAQLPGNFRHRPRAAKISSRNFAGLCSMHNFSKGKRDGNPWGEAVTILSTPAQQPVYFNFHNTPLEEDSRDSKVKALGNTQIIGQSGGGKTVLALFLLANLLKYGTQVVFFDKDRGAEIAIRAMGGKYLPLERGAPTGFSPFKLDPTPKTVQFWIDLVAFCTTIRGQDHTPREMAAIVHAANAVAKMPTALRSFDLFMQNLPTGDGNDLVDRLEKWGANGQFGWALNSENDELQFEDGRLYGFDYTEILDDAATCPAIMMYLMFRVESLIDGRRFAFFMDEYWKALSINYFEDFAKNKQKTIRKQNGFGVYMTQSPSDTLASDIAKTLIEQSATYIFLPNPAADHDDYVNGFKLTEHEFLLVKSLQENSRMFLLKQGHIVSLAKLDLNGFAKELTVLSGTTDNIARLDRLRAEYGDDPQAWLEPFMNGENV